MTFKKYLLLLLCLPCFVQAKNITISRLTCEMQEGLVVVESCPRLGWAMESTYSMIVVSVAPANCFSKFAKRFMISS